MTDDSPRILHTGEGKVLIGFTADELLDLMAGTTIEKVYLRLLSALELLDAEKAKEYR